MERILPGASSPDTKPKSKCRRCGNEYDKPLFYEHSSRDNYCSDECFGAARQEYLAKKIQETIYKVIPRRYRDIETDKKELLAKMKGRSIFLNGSVGTGKTVFMASMAKDVIRSGGEVKWISYPAFIMELQNAFADNSKKNPYEIAESVARYQGWLAIDDLGAEKLTDFVRQITYYIINEREQRCLPVLITSNFTLQKINDQIDPRIASRIAGLCETLRMSGDDKRAAKGEK